MKDDMKLAKEKIEGMVASLVVYALEHDFPGGEVVKIMRAKASALLGEINYRKNKERAIEARIARRKLDRDKLVYLKRYIDGASVSEISKKHSRSRTTVHKNIINGMSICLDSSIGANSHSGFKKKQKEVTLKGGEWVELDVLDSKWVNNRWIQGDKIVTKKYWRWRIGLAFATEHKNFFYTAIDIFKKERGFEGDAQL
jgi:hypothetical protein